MRMAVIAVLLGASAASLGAVSAAADPAPPAPTINQNGVNIHDAGHDLNDPHQVIDRAEQGDTLDLTSICMTPSNNAWWIHTNIDTHHATVHGVVRSDMVSGVNPLALPGCPPQTAPTPVQ